jgi:hypothetical protein
MTREEAKAFIASMAGRKNFTKEELIKYKQALAVLANKWSLPS